MLRALGLLLADVPPQWRGGRLFGALENDHNSIPRCETNRLSEGHKRSVDKIWGRTAKTDLGPKTKFSGPKDRALPKGRHGLATTRKSSAK